MDNQIKPKRISFCDDLNYIKFDENMKGSATMTLKRRAVEMNYVGTRKVVYNDVVEKQNVEDFQTYSQAWVDAGRVMRQTLELDEVIMNALLLEERETCLLGHPMYTRLQELQVALLHYIRISFLNSFFEGVAQSVAVALRDKNWDVIREVITLMEVEYCPLKDFDFEVVAAELEIRDTDYFRMVDRVRSKVLKTYEGETSDGFERECMRRWREHFLFFTEPIEYYTEEKAKFVKLYFSIFDTGIKLSLINNTYYDAKPFAKKFIDWKFPDELLLEEPYRILFPPLVCADREFSCNFQAPDKSFFPEYQTVDDIRALPDSFISKLSASKQPGKLLLLLIRMNLKEMVFFCIDNGLSVNLQANTGHCMSLKWINEEANFEEVATTEFSKPKKQLLEKEFAFETPLSVAVETAVYGAGTDIVSRLLEEGANPLLCADIAVKRCINAVSLLATPKNMHILSIPYDQIPQRPNQKINPTGTVKEMVIEQPVEEEPLKKPSKRIDSKNRRRRSNVAQNTFLKRGSVNDKTLEPKNSEIRAVMAMRRKSGSSVKALTSNFEKKPAAKPPPTIRKTRSGNSVRSLTSNFEKKTSQKSIISQGSGRKEKAPVKASKRVESELTENKKSSAVPDINLRQISVASSDAGAVKPDFRIDSGSSQESANTGKSAGSKKRRRGKRKFAKKRAARLKNSNGFDAMKNRAASKPDSEFDLRDPAKASILDKPVKQVLRKGPRVIEALEDLPSSSKEHIARVRANRVMKDMLRTADNYKKLKHNYFTKTLLYQACLEGREEAIRVILESKSMQRLREMKIHRVKSGASAVTEAESVTTWNVDAEMPLSTLQAQGVLDEDNFDLIVYVIDKFLNDGLKKEYPNYDALLRPIYIIMRRYKLYPNNWRFVQLFHIIKLAMKQNLAGDRDILLKFLQLPQMQHYLNLKRKSIWERVRFENRMYSKSRRAELKIEAPTLTNDELYALDENNLDTSLTRMEIVPKETGQIDKLFKYATRMESIDIISCLVGAGAFPAHKTAGHMMAMSVKSQNVNIIRYIYEKFTMRTMLTKAFIIALKGKYHQSMGVIFDLGFSLQPQGEEPTKTGLIDARLRQLLSLFSKSIDDVLFERTVFDKDDGRRHKFNFTRQDEEETFYLLVKYLFKNVEFQHLKRIVNKIVARSMGAHESRIWFYGYHSVFRQIVKNEYFDLVTPEFIEVYKLNYGQWLMYIRELESQFRREREREFREKALSRSSIRRRLSSKSEKPQYSPIDDEAFVTMAKAKVARTLEEIFGSCKHENVVALNDAVHEVRELVQSAKGTEKTPCEAVSQNCRRSGSRNYDFISLNNALHGSSGFL